MGKYTVKRILLVIPSLLLVATLIFGIFYCIPGGIASRMGEAHSGGQALIMAGKHYGLYIKDVFTGNWQTFVSPRQLKRVAQLWEPTLLIALLATVITVFMAIPLGVFSATRRNKPLDYGLSLASSVIASAPTFCMSLLLCYLFAVKLDLFPTSGYVPVKSGGLWKSLQYVILPSFGLGLQNVAMLARYTRSAMLDVLNQEYIRTARAKGLSLGQVYYKHALKNTLALVATVLAAMLMELVAGVVVVERAFNIRGLGNELTDSIMSRDYPVAQLFILIMAFVFMLVALMMDLFLKALDPKVEYE